jgi:MarR family transcriptional regulator, 2-MHQ and catechol-resistance regulon repressor
MATITRPQPDASTHAEAHEPDLDEATAAALRLWVIMSRAQSAVTTQAAAHVQQHGLTLAEFGILEALYHRGPMLLGEVQKRILVSSGGITFLVDRLTAKGLVERRSCDYDRRARYAALTAKGTELVATIFPSHAAVIVRAMSAIGTEEQVDVANRLRELGRAAATLPLPADSEQAK